MEEDSTTNQPVADMLEFSLAVEDGGDTKEEIYRDRMDQLICSTTITKSICSAGILEYSLLLGKFRLQKGKIGSRYFLLCCIDLFNTQLEIFKKYAPRSIEDRSKEYENKMRESFDDFIQEHGKDTSGFITVFGNIMPLLRNLFLRCSRSPDCKRHSTYKWTHLKTPETSPKSPRHPMSHKRLFKDKSEAAKVLRSFNETCAGTTSSPAPSQDAKKNNSKPKKKPSQREPLNEIKPCQACGAININSEDDKENEKPLL